MASERREDLYFGDRRDNETLGAVLFENLRGHAVFAHTRVVEDRRARSQAHVLQHISLSGAIHGLKALHGLKAPAHKFQKFERRH